MDTITTAGKPIAPDPTTTAGRPSLEDFVKERVASVEKRYSHSGVYVVTLKPEFSFPSDAAPHKMSFSTKKEALDMIHQATKIQS
jgi:hypothetical protein